MTRYSNSYIQKFAQCPLAAHYKYDLHLTPTEGDSHDLVFGRAFAKALEVLRLKRDLKKAKAVFREHCPLPPESELAKTVENGIFALDKYVECYNWDQNWKVLATEAMDSTEDGFVVKLDAVVEDTRTGNILGIDDKTTKSYLDYKFFSKFDPNSQVTQYIRYIKEKYGNCDGFIINAIRFYHNKKRSAIREAGSGVEFERQVFQRTGQQIAQEQESKDYWIGRIEHAKTTGIWGMNTSQCFLCEYQPACGAGWDWENDSQLILNTFRQSCQRWIPEQQVHCNLDLNHEGDHGHLLQPVGETEFVVEV